MINFFKNIGFGIGVILIIFAFIACFVKILECLVLLFMTMPLYFIFGCIVVGGVYIAYQIGKEFRENYID